MNSLQTTVRAAQTHCVNDHEFTRANTLTDGRGNRHCRPCARIRGRDHMRRKRAAARALLNGEGGAP